MAVYLSALSLDLRSSSSWKRVISSLLLPPVQLIYGEFPLLRPLF